MTDKKKKDSNTPESPDTLVDALESIKSLLAKSDSKLAAARESIAIASNQTSLGKIDPEKFEIPILHDVVNPSDIESATEDVSSISEQLSEKIDETLAVVAENIPTLHELESHPDPQIMLDCLDSLQKNLEKSLRDSLMKSIVTIEVGLKKTLANEMNKVRKQVKKDFK